jgi:hypothetical protein
MACQPPAAFLRTGGMSCFRSVSQATGITPGKNLNPSSPDSTRSPHQGGRMRRHRPIPCVVHPDEKVDIQFISLRSPDFDNSLYNVFAVHAERRLGVMMDATPIDPHENHG